MKITIEIPDEEIKEALKEKVIDMIVNDNRWGSDGRAFRREYSDIVKEMIYKPEIKNDIINRTIDIAAQEIRRKAMPKLFGKMMENENLHFRPDNGT